MVDLFSVFEEPLCSSQARTKSLFFKLVFVAVNCRDVGDNLKNIFNLQAAKQCDNGVIILIFDLHSLIC